MGEFRCWLPFLTGTDYLTLTFKITFYERENGEEPARLFLDSLNKKMRTKMVRTIVMLGTNGTKLREPYSKPLEDGIFELRAKFGSDISRTLYFFYVGREIVLTNGFIKKTEQTPKGEIVKAKKYRDDFLARRANRK